MIVLVAIFFLSIFYIFDFDDYISVLIHSYVFLINSYISELILYFLNYLLKCQPIFIFFYQFLNFLIFKWINFIVWINFFNYFLKISFFYRKVAHGTRLLIGGRRRRRRHGRWRHLFRLVGESVAAVVRFMANDGLGRNGGRLLLLLLLLLFAVVVDVLSSARTAPCSALFHLSRSN